MRSDPKFINWETKLNSAFEHENTIDVWKIPVLSGKSQIKILSDEDQSRLGKIHSNDARAVFYSSRVYLKNILAGYVNLPLEQLHFSKHPSGKPFIKNTAVEFNLSHSGQMILLAVTQSDAVGIDVEKNRAVKNWRKIAEKVFSKSQLNELQNSKKPAEAFCRIWTEFESIQKMTGNGVFGTKPSADRITHYHFIPESNYLACVAYKKNAEVSKIRFFDAEPLTLTSQ
jgi:phosphopantetheinyl transferase